MGDRTEADDIRDRCVEQSYEDAKHFVESGLAEALGVKEEDIRERLLKINLAKARMRTPLK